MKNMEENRTITNETNCFFEINPIRYSFIAQKASTTKTVKTKIVSAPTKAGLIHAVDVVKNPKTANIFENKILRRLTKDFINQNRWLCDVAFDDWEKSGIRINIPFEFDLYDVERFVILDYLCRQSPIKSKIFQIYDNICKKVFVLNTKQIVLK